MGYEDSGVLYDYVKLQGSSGDLVALGGLSGPQAGGPKAELTVRSSRTAIPMNVRRDSAVNAASQPPTVTCNPHAKDESQLPTVTYNPHAKDESQLPSGTYNPHNVAALDTAEASAETTDGPLPEKRKE